MTALKRILIGTLAMFVIVGIMFVIYRRYGLEKVGAVVANIAGPAPINLTHTGEYTQVPITVSRKDMVWVQFPESVYTKSFEMDFDKKLMDLNDPNWWNALHDEVVNVYESERGLTESHSIHTEITIGDPTPDPNPYLVTQVPSVEWLKANVSRGKVSPLLLATSFSLPEGGSLIGMVNEEDYKKYYASDFPSNRANLAKDQVSLDGVVEHYYWEIFYYPDTQLYQADLKYVHAALSGRLLFRYPDGIHYLVFDLPPAVLNQTADSLAKVDYSITLTVEILSK